MKEKFVLVVLALSVLYVPGAHAQTQTQGEGSETHGYVAAPRSSQEGGSSRGATMEFRPGTSRACTAQGCAEPTVRPAPCRYSEGCPRAYPYAVPVPSIPEPRIPRMSPPRASREASQVAFANLYRDHAAIVESGNIRDRIRATANSLADSLGEPLENVLLSSYVSNITQTNSLRCVGGQSIYQLAFRVLVETPAEGETETLARFNCMFDVQVGNCRESVVRRAEVISEAACTPHTETSVASESAPVEQPAQEQPAQEEPAAPAEEVTSRQ